MLGQKPKGPARFPIAPNGVFWSLQGEGRLVGDQMAFLRLAGCSVGCAECDTDYSVSERLGLDEIHDRLLSVLPDQEGRRRVQRVVWVTGGEPYDHPRLPELVRMLKRERWTVCVATSGTKPITTRPDWISVSPHSHSSPLTTFAGDEIKLVEGLNGLDLRQWNRTRGHAADFSHKYVQPLSRPGPGGSHVADVESLRRCMEFLADYPDWSLSEQRHHAWGVM